MIAKLSGIVDSLREDGLVVDVQGVGYLVFCSAATLRRLPAAGNPVTVIVETHVREDHIHLYGFLDKAEQEWFRHLQTVQGVGSKVALAILSAVAPAALAHAIAAQDKTVLTEADGVGPKLAQRIVNELKDKVGGPVLGVVGIPVGKAADAAGTAAAISALVNLGYRRAEAFGAVSQAAQRLGTEAPVAELIRAGLKELAP
ncbi:MAG: Holliday junction branch migration protein RuvA [Alphaproteobacteria bacterium]